MPPESISACGEYAAKVRKVLIRLHRGGESYKTQASAVTSSTLPEFESRSSVSTCPPSLKLGVVDRSGSSSQLRVSEMVSRVTRRFFESQCYSECNEQLVVRDKVGRRHPAVRGPKHP